jgi:hypothetical protein
MRFSSGIYEVIIEATSARPDSYCLDCFNSLRILAHGYEGYGKSRVACTKLELG